MKHAGVETLRQLSDLLGQIRQRPALKEKKLGLFYRRSKSFLHFHEDTAGVFADLSFGDSFERYPANTKQEWKALLSALDRALRT
jgi:hypothetical protein